MTAPDREVIVDPAALTADVARLAAMNVEVLDRLAFALFSGHRSSFDDLQAHVRQVLDDMTAMAERLRGGDGEATPRCSEGDIAEMMAGQYAPKGVTP
jgi:hypothetical protein